MPVLSKATVVVRDVRKTYKSQNGPVPFRRKKGLDVEALKGVSFVAKQGESIGLIGTNGSGKSTLLSIISSGESPTSGLVLSSSQPTLLSVNAVLQSTLTGWQNIRLGLLAKGITRREIEKLVKEVGEWSSIGSALDRPLGTYSSGMRARLKYSIATAVPSEILLVDEALGTGDASFAAKATRRMQDFLDEAGTVFVVAHSANTIKTQCNRAIWLEKGEIIADGDVEEVVDTYSEWSRLNSVGDEGSAEELRIEALDKYERPQIILSREAESML